MPLSCGKHHLQGVWGRALPPAGSARGGARSQLRSNTIPRGKQQAPLHEGWGGLPASEEREGRSPLAITKQQNT
jgi:hypothetical protein